MIVLIVLGVLVFFSLVLAWMERPPVRPPATVIDWGDTDGWEDPDDEF